MTREGFARTLLARRAKLTARSYAMSKGELRLLAFFAALPRERKKLLLRVMKPMAKKRKA